MIAPGLRGQPIDGRRFSTWKSLFSGYKHQVNDSTINFWLNQFRKSDQDLAARILDCVDFITAEQMAAAFRSSLNSLPEWDNNTNSLKGRWRFVAFSRSAGESGDSMLHKFRVATRLNGKRFDSLFPYKSELLGQNLTHEDTVVFVDDFSGTGKQVCDAWKDNIGELLPNSPRIYLILIAASINARKRITKETGLTPFPYRELAEEENVFSDKNRHFNQREKTDLLNYCKKADPKNPKGFGDCGFLVVFSHGCPNNSIPILHANNQKWKGIFPRYD